MIDPESRFSEFQGMPLSRRTVTKGLFGAVAGAALPLGLARPAQAAPKKGGILRLGMSGGSGTDSLDPTTTNNPVMSAFDYTIYGCLVELDAQGRAVPDIAESWEPMNGGQQWVFHLRKGVEFSNGKTLDADDVVYSLNRHRGDNTKSVGAGLLRQISDLKADDKNTVTISLTGKNPDLPFILALYLFGIVPNGWSDWAHPVGSGPYVVKSFLPGSRIVASRHPNFWKPERGWFDGIELTVINDPTAKLNALMTGQIDAMNRVDRRTVKLLEGNPDVKIVRSSGGLHYYYSMDLRLPGYSDNNVRLALKHGIDREQALKTILQGYGKIGNDHPIKASDVFYNPNIPQHTYDPDKSKFYLKKAGMETFKIALSTSTGVFQEAIEDAVLFSQSGKKAGLDIEVVRETAEGYWTNAFMKKPMFGAYASGEVTANIMFDRCYKSDSPMNECRWNNPQFDKLFAQAREETDETRRRDMYWEMQSIVHEDNGRVIPLFADFIDACRSNVGGIDPNPTRELNGYRVCERAYFTA